MYCKPNTTYRTNAGLIEVSKRVAVLSFLWGPRRLRTRLASMELAYEILLSFFFLCPPKHHAKNV